MTAPRRAGPGRSGPEGPRNTRPSRPHTAGGRGRAHPQPTAQPPGGRGRPGRDPLLGPGRPPSIHGGQLLEPLAVQAIRHPPQHLDPVGLGGVGEPVQLPGDQPVNDSGQRRQVIRRLGRMCVRVHGGNLPSPPTNTSTNPKMWTTISASDPTRAERRGSTTTVDAAAPRHRSATLPDQGTTLRAGSSQRPAGSRATRCPATCMGPEQPEPPCQATAWGPKPPARTDGPPTPDHRARPNWHGAQWPPGPADPPPALPPGQPSSGSGWSVALRRASRSLSSRTPRRRASRAMEMRLATTPA